MMYLVLFIRSEIDNLKIFDEHSIPKLETVLRMFPDMKFQIDVKTDEVAMPALASYSRK